MKIHPAPVAATAALTVAGLGLALTLQADETRFDLSWKAGPGEKVHVVSTVKSSIEGTLQFQKRQGTEKEEHESVRSGETRIKSDWTDEVKEAEGGQVRRLKRVVTSMDVTGHEKVVEDGQEQPKAEDPDDEAYRALDGKTLEVERDGEDVRLGGKDAEKLSQRTKKKVVIDHECQHLLPKAPVALNETWRVEGIPARRIMNMGRQHDKAFLDVDGGVDCKLAAVEESGGRRCARITFQGKVGFQLDLAALSQDDEEKPARKPLTFPGSCTVKGELLVSLDGARETKLTSTGTMKVKGQAKPDLTGQGEAMADAEVTVTVEMDGSMELEETTRSESGH